MCNIFGFFLVITTLLLGPLVKAEDENDGMSLEDAVQMLESFASNCDPVPEREHIEELVLNKKDAQKETKCFRYCLMKEFNLVEEGNTQMEKEQTKTLMEMVVQNNEAVVIEIIDKCNAQNAAITDKCEAAHAHGMCVLDEFKERNIKLPEIKQ